MNAFLKENKQLLILAVPLIINYFIEGCPNFINNVMMARLGQDELAAGAIVSNAFTSIVVFLYGLLSAASTLISHKYGAKENQRIAEIIRDASIIGIICSVFLIPLLWYGDRILSLLGQPQQLVALATPYLHGLIFAVIPDFATMILWQFFIGLGRPKVTLISSILYVPINIGANYILMFGKLGFPALGMLGIGLGTGIAYWVLFISFFFYIIYQPEYRQYFGKHVFHFHSRYINEILRIGLPTGAVWLIGMSFTMLASFFAGKLNATLLAAQQVAMQAIGITFMTLSGLSQAIGVRIGHMWGAKYYAECKMIAFIGVMMCTVLGTFFSLIFWLKPLWIVGIDFDLSQPQNADVIQLACDYLFIFGFYQIANSIRYGLFGALRALKDTYFSAVISFIGFYGIAIVPGYFLLFHWGGSLTQFWYLSTAASFFIVIAMYKRLGYCLKRIE